MNLNQLEALIRIRREGLFDKSELDFLLEDEWVREENDKYRLTEQAESRLAGVLSMFVSNKIDPTVIENYERQIAFEIKSNSKSFVKTRQIRIKLMARPEILNELVNRYSTSGWNAAHENGAIFLKWVGDKEKACP